MRMFLFAKRNPKEVLRAPINLFFGLGFPLVLAVLLSIINAAIPPEAENRMFEIGNLAPGFGDVRERFYGTVCRYAVIKRPHILFLNAVIYFSYDCDGFYFSEVL